MLLLSALASASLAGSEPHEHAPVGLDHDALWEAYVEHFEGDGAAEHGWGCATGVVMALKERWAEFTPAEQARITAQVAPFKADLTAPLELERPTDLPMLPATDTCWGQQGANRVTGEHFSVEWDGSSITTTKAQQFLDALEYAWDVQFGELGWRIPSGANTYLIMAYVSDQNYAGAYTTVERCGTLYMPYIAAGKGSFSSGSWYKDMAGHELNHASQFSYGFAHEFWFWEATATHVQDDILPTSEQWSPYITGYADQPWLAMNASDQNDQDIFWHMYGMAIWLFYIDQHHYGETFAVEAWEAAVGQGGNYSLDMQDLIADLGMDFDEVYDGFIAANTVMDYDTSYLYPEVALTDDVDDLGATGAGDDVGYLGQNYIRFDGDLATDELPDLTVAFDGEAGGDWTALLVGTEDDDIVEIVKFELDDEEGEATLSDFGRFDDVYLVVSPRSGPTSTWHYAWDADGSAPPEPDPDPTDDTDALDDGGEVALTGGCGCNGAAGSGLAGGWALLIGLIGLRRRHS